MAFHVSPSTYTPPSPHHGALSLTTRPGEEMFLPRDISSRFGVRLRELRQAHRFTQLRMAHEFGIDRTFISDVERGRKSISLPMLEVVALGFHISLSELLRNL